MFDELELAVKELEELEPDRLTDDELVDALLELRKQRQLLEAVRARFTRAIAERGV